MKRLNKKQEEVLSLVCSGLCVNIGVDSFHCHLGTMKALEKRGLVFYGKFPSNGQVREIGWQPTEEGKTLSALLSTIKFIT